MNSITNNLNFDKKEQIERGKRIKFIRENELNMNKTSLAKEIGISSQFLGLIEEGKGNLVYKNLRKLMDVSGHSSDYILFGLDDSIINNTKKCIENFSCEEISQALKIIEDLSIFIKNI